MSEINYSDYLKNTIIIQYTNKIIKILYLILFSLLVTSIVYSIFFISTEVIQGESYKIIYIHVPLAWFSLLNYTLITVLSIIFLIKKNPITFIYYRYFILTGTIITLLTLLTGSLWAKPMWGSYWVWDARLTTVLILNIIYIILYIISLKVQETDRNISIISIISIVGFINIPLIKLSVDWWTTLHQASSITQFESKIHISIIIGILLFFFTIIIYQIILMIYYVRINYLNNKYKYYY